VEAAVSESQETVEPEGPRQGPRDESRERSLDEPHWRLGRGRMVPLGEADRELRRSWAAIDEDSRVTDGEGMLRLREVNLVVVTGERDCEQARVTAALTAMDHPGRVIVVAPGGTGSSASIATGCLIDEFSKRRVCSEEVVIQGAQGQEEQLHAAILQLLVPDVPVVGWWMGDLGHGAESLPWLADVTDQLVTNLAPAADPRICLKVLTDLIAERPDLRLRDMEWLRVAPWRELTAELFERPDRRLLVPEIERLEVRHQAAPMQALLFAAWFAYRLGMSVGAGEWSGGRGTASLTMTGSAPAALVVDLIQEPEVVRRADGLSEVRVHLGAELDGGAPGERECVGRAIAISRLPHSLVCRCGTGEVFDQAVLKSSGITEQDDHRLLSLVIDTPVHESGLREMLRTALELSLAPGFPA
jgi:glucose-6-phosphate dehydrogenase assembly protein OpcA